MSKWITSEGLDAHYNKVKLVANFMQNLNIGIKDLVAHFIVCEAQRLEKEIGNTFSECLEFALEQHKTIEADDQFNELREVEESAKAFASTIEPKTVTQEWAEFVVNGTKCQGLISLIREEYPELESDLKCDYILSHLDPLPQPVADMVCQLIRF